LLFLAK